jgi:hypothetical protein
MFIRNGYGVKVSTLWVTDMKNSRDSFGIVFPGVQNFRGRAGIAIPATGVELHGPFHIQQVPS